MGALENLDLIFEENFIPWTDKNLDTVLSEEFAQWVINPLEESVEVFVDKDPNKVVELTEDLVLESVLIAMRFLEDMNRRPFTEYSVELLPEVVSDYMELHPLSELGDEPFDADVRYKLDGVE